MDIGSQGSGFDMRLNCLIIKQNFHVFCHHERSEGSSNDLYILAGFFATLRMTA